MMSNENFLQIGAIAKITNLNIQTIRYYEHQGILKPDEKTNAGYRLYSKETVNRLRFIKRAQTLGFSLQEIKELLNLKAPSINRCANVSKKAKTKLLSTQEKIRQLRQIEKTLISLITTCDNNQPSTQCPIIDHMEKAPYE